MAMNPIMEEVYGSDRTIGSPGVYQLMQGGGTYGGGSRAAAQGSPSDPRSASASDLWAALSSGGSPGKSSGFDSSTPRRTSQYSTGRRLFQGQDHNGAGGPPQPSPQALEEQQRKAERQAELLRMMLQEIKQNAAFCERQLHELSFDLRRKTEECERLKRQLKLTPDQLDEERIRNETYDPKVQAEIIQLRKEITALEEELERERETKMAYLRRVDRTLNGGPSATAGDSILFTTVDRPRAATSFTRIVSALPSTNVERLEDCDYFEFAKAAIHAAVVQSQRKRAAVDLESAMFTALHHSGHKANLARIVSVIDEDDLARI